MNDKQLLGEVGSWLKDTDAAQPDAERITARAMAQVPQVRQRGRWWPLPIGSALPPGSQPVPASGSTAFAALKFVTAGVIVGLFGGFLLAGVLTTQEGDRIDPAAVTDSPSPMTIERLLSVAETTEVEPGILQVVGDGVRDLASNDNISIVSGRDGGIWLLSEDRFLRVGAEETHQWPSGQAEAVNAFGVAPDGTVWTVGQGEDGISILRSFDGERWISHEPTSDTRAIDVALDGRVWVAWQDQGSEMVSLGYLVGGERQPVGEWEAGQLHGG
ncbi:MAG: hypothetical protein U9O18_07525, partial [Chloroflexota bacterium]|nr:hypothetical protein [Chloroflexota bacterium]